MVLDSAFKILSTPKYLLIWGISTALVMWRSCPQLGHGWTEDGWSVGSLPLHRRPRHGARRELT